MSYIELQNLKKEFDVPGGIEVAVDGVSLDIEEGEFISLVGPSGCGKTTTLRCIAGLETPTEGEIRIEAEDVTKISPQNRDLAMVFQRIALYPNMTVQENIEYPLKLDGVAKEERARRAEETANLVQVGDLLGKYPSELSGGQQQRVALSRAIIRDPVAFLMDEPMSDLDAKLKRQMRKEFGEIHKDLNATIIYVTHNQEEAMTMSDKIAVMNDGEIEQFGTPESIYQHPNNLFVARFIGSPEINTISAEITEQQDTHVVVETEGGYEIELETEEPLPTGIDSGVVVGFRPQQTTITRDGRGIETTVKLNEPLGNDVSVFLDDPSGELELRSVVQVGDEIKEGSTAHVQIAQEGIQLFDSDTGEHLTQSQQKVRIEQRGNVIK